MCLTELRRQVNVLSSSLDGQIEIEQFVTNI